jgi:acyl-CoA reductase-like NAD-dependent aldehyde dehydrogenase
MTHDRVAIVPRPHGRTLGAPLAASTPAEIDAAVEAAAEAFDWLARQRPGATCRPACGMADALEGDREALVPWPMTKPAWARCA